MQSAGPAIAAATAAATAAAGAAAAAAAAAAATAAVKVKAARGNRSTCRHHGLRSTTLNWIRLTPGEGRVGVAASPPGITAPPQRDWTPSHKDAWRMLGIGFLRFPGPNDGKAYRLAPLFARGLARAAVIRSISRQM